MPFAAALLIASAKMSQDLPKAQLDGFDVHIVRILRGDGRISNADLAAAVGLSPSACLCRRSGVIRGYVAIIHEGTPEDQLAVFTRITLDRQTEEYLHQLETPVCRGPEITDCHLMTGLADYLLKIEVRNAGDDERLHKEGCRACRVSRASSPRSPSAPSSAAPPPHDRPAAPRLRIPAPKI